MKIQYMSDLHLEFADNSRYIKNNEFPVTGDVLVLAGDIFYLRNDVAPLDKFWKWASANYREKRCCSFGTILEMGICQLSPSADSARQP